MIDARGNEMMQKAEEKLTKWSLFSKGNKYEKALELFEEAAKGYLLADNFSAAGKAYIRMAEMHEKLVTIHPFIDGNGRTARLVMNLILLRHGYVIANIKGDFDTRMNYYNSLEAVQTHASKESFVLFAAQVEKQSLERYLSIIDTKHP